MGCLTCGKPTRKRRYWERFCPDHGGSQLKGAGKKPRPMLRLPVLSVPSGPPPDLDLLLVMQKVSDPAILALLCELKTYRERKAELLKMMERPHAGTRPHHPDHNDDSGLRSP